MSWRENSLAAQAAEALGEPEQVFHLSKLRVAVYVSIGFLLLLWGFAGTYLLVLLNLSLPKVLVYMPAIFGCVLIYRSFSARGLAVLTYPTGILIAKQDEVWTCTWDEICKIYMIGVQDESKTKKVKIAVTQKTILQAATYFNYRGGKTLTIKTKDNRTSTIPSAIPNYAKLCVLIQEKIFDQLWENFITQIESGETVQIGQLDITQNEIVDTLKKKTLPINELNEIAIKYQSLQINKKASFFSNWLTLPIAELPNINLLVHWSKTRQFNRE